MTSALAYSLNSSGQLSMSIIRSHTAWRGALMTTSLSVCAGTSSDLLLGQSAVDVLDRLADRRDLGRVLVGDREPVLLLHGELDLDEGERVEPHVLEGRVGVVDDVLLGQSDAVDEDVLEVRERERLRHERAPFQWTGGVGENLTAALSRINHRFPVGRASAARAGSWACAA